MESLPSPVKDEMHPFWVVPNEVERVQLEMFVLGDMDFVYDRHSSSSIIIQHLYNYGYTPEKYQEQANFLKAVVLSVCAHIVALLQVNFVRFGFYRPCGVRKAVWRKLFKRPARKTISYRAKLL